MMAPASNFSVIGWPLVPLPWNVSPVAPAEPLIVPHKWTVVPGPIWPAPDPQLAEVLKKETGRAFAQLEPFWLPVPF